jgi:hypothetical protein
MPKKLDRIAAIAEDDRHRFWGGNAIGFDQARIPRSD